MKKILVHCYILSFNSKLMDVFELKHIILRN